MFKIPVYGLTGNMGCGKSTFAKCFDKFPDVVVIDADSIAKEIVRDKQYGLKMLKLFGSKVFSGNLVDLKKVAKLVFNDPKALRKLERFVHPLTWQSICKKIEDQKPGVSFFLIEAPLLYEAGWRRFFDAVIVVTCDKTEQYRRLHDSKKLSYKQINSRLKRQLSNKVKVNLADFVVDTHCPIKELENKAHDLYHTLSGGVDR